MKKLISFGKNSVWALFGTIVLWLLIVCGNVTVRMNIDEHSYLLHDSMLKNMICTASLFFVLVTSNHIWSLYIKTKKNKEKIYNVLIWTMFIIMGFISVLIILCTQNDARADQIDVMNCAKDLRYHNYGCLEPGGYLYIYPNQYGIVLILYFVSFIFGEYNFLTFQIMNLVALIAFYKVVELLIKDTFGRKTSALTIAMGAVFLPLILYINFVYGTLMGLSCCGGALLFFKQYYDKGKYHYLAVAIILCGFAMWLKQNYLIFVVGYFIYSVFLFLDNAKIKTALVPIVLFLTLIIGSITPGIVMEKLTGIQSEGGVSSFSFIAMGLQENDGMYDGWYNGYNRNTYIDSGCDGAIQADISKGYILDRIDEFKTSPLYAVNFFAGKNASQWANPDFQGFWINNIMEHRSRVMKPDWVARFFSLRGSDSIAQILDVLQFWILAGTLLYLVDNKRDNLCLCLATIVIGGFIFYTFWEAKGQYTLPYFVLMLPISAAGWSRITELIENYVIKVKDDKKWIKAIRPHRRILIISLIIFITVSIISVKGNEKINKMFAFDRFDDESYNEYVNDNSSAILEDRKCYIKSWSFGLNLRSNYENDLGLYKLDSNSDKNIIIESYGDASLIYFSDIKKYLDVPEGKAQNGTYIQVWDANKSIAQQWIIKENEDRTCSILYCGDKNLALTVDGISNRLFLSEFNKDDPNQKWEIKTD